MSALIVLAVCRIRLQHDPHLVRGGHRRVGAALPWKRSLQPEEGRLSFNDLGVDLGAEIFKALSDVPSGGMAISCTGR